MKQNELITLINESNIYGTFVEIGAGQPVSAAIFGVSGASNTIYRAESPYGKDYQEERYGTKGIRSVSKEFCEQVLVCLRSEIKPKHTTQYVSSFQIADKPGMITHGWIAVDYLNTVYYYHITLPDSYMDRERTISIIGSIGLRILYHKNDVPALITHLKKESANYSVIDIIEGKQVDVCKEAAIQLCDMGLANHITFGADGKLMRLEDLLRKGDLIIMKGSFNPVHNHHIEIMEAAQRKYPKATPCFCISMDTYEKDHIVNTLNLLGRIKMLNKLGYPVIIMRKGLFSQCTFTLRNSRHFNDKIIYPLGTDTLNRLIASSYENFSKMKGEHNLSVGAFNTHFENVEFPYMGRPGTLLTELSTKVAHFIKLGDEISPESSTTVRELYAKGDHNEIKKMIPKEIHDLYFEFMEEQSIRELTVSSNQNK
jgi:nicotinic acid mononucleotide adenylyltransferase